MGNIPRTLVDAFYTNDPSFGIALFVNDAVAVTSGEHASKKGCVISLEEVHPEQEYLVEFEDGTDAIIQLSRLSLLQRNVTSGD